MTSHYVNDMGCMTKIYTTVCSITTILSILLTNKERLTPRVLLPTVVELKVICSGIQKCLVEEEMMNLKSQMNDGLFSQLLRDKSSRVWSLKI